MSKSSNEKTPASPSDPPMGKKGEVTACPTGLADPEQAETAKLPGGVGAPGTAAPSVKPSPGEGISEEEIERSEKKPPTSKE